MAENKKAFVLYADLINTVRKMPKGKRAELFMAILEYVNDENPIVEDLIVSLVYEPVKLQLKRDLLKYEKFRSKQIENGQKGGRPQAKKETQNNPNNPSLYLETQKSLTVTDTVTDTVTVREIIGTSPVIFRIEECLTVAMNDPRWVSANKATKKDLDEFNVMLEKRGVYDKNPFDYKTHYANWKSGGKKDENFKMSVVTDDSKARKLIGLE